MTLTAFQRALCELIGSPDLCLAVRAEPGEFLSRYQLTPRERERLRDIVWQTGMSTSCTLYRSNRVTPIYTLLHSTCLVLGDRLKTTLDAYWSVTDLRDLEFQHEIDRFAGFVRDRLASGALADPFLEEVLEFEAAVNALRYAARREVLRTLEERDEATPASAALRVHPLMRVVRFRHEPVELLESLAASVVPQAMADAESYLLLSVVDGTLSVQTLEAEDGRLLHRLQAEGIAPSGAALDAFVANGLVVTMTATT